MVRISSFLVVMFVATVAGAGQSPYAGFQSREIKALSDADVRGYREGAGMSLALAAELNGYPGPKHVLELAEPLELTPEQRTKVELVMARMKRDAIRIGEAILDAEKALDAAFRESTIDPKRLDELTATIGSAQGRLRHTHLLAHIETRALLTRHQLHEYARLRGYDSGHGHAHQH